MRGGGGGDVRRRGVVLAGDEEAGARVGVPEVRAVRQAVVDRDSGDASGGLSDPLRLAELGRGAQEDALALHFVVLVREQAGLADRRAVVVAAYAISQLQSHETTHISCAPRVHAGEGDTAPVRPSVRSIISDHVRRTDQIHDAPIEHIITNQLRVRRPVLLVKHVLEVRARQDRARVVPRARPRVERAALELGHVPRLARVHLGVVLVVVRRDVLPHVRVRAVEGLWVCVLRAESVGRRTCVRGPGMSGTRNTKERKKENEDGGEDVRGRRCRRSRCR